MICTNEVQQTQKMIFIIDDYVLQGTALEFLSI